ncbi:441_t:CDS:2, partial [Ambispora leptoticha]
NAGGGDDDDDGYEDYKFMNELEKAQKRKDPHLHLIRQQHQINQPCHDREMNYGSLFRITRELFDLHGRGPRHLRRSGSDNLAESGLNDDNQREPMQQGKEFSETDATITTPPPPKTSKKRKKNPRSEIEEEAFMAMIESLKVPDKEEITEPEKIVQSVKIECKLKP